MVLSVHAYGIVELLLAVEADTANLADRVASACVPAYVVILGVVVCSSHCIILSMLLDAGA